MANAQTHNLLGVTDKRRDINSGANPHSSTTTSNVRDVTAMRARLTAINAGLYTSAYLDNMLVNDMLYAIRLNDEAAGI